MNICAIGSGSSGNSFLISNDEENILIDVGFSLKELTRRLNKIGIDIKNISAVFVSHEHYDHIRGIEPLYNKQIPIYMNEKTFEATNLRIKPNLFKTNNEINISNFKILPFIQQHDGVEPCGFKIKDIDKEKIISIMTDFGKPNENNYQALKESDALVLESNHDIDMLINGPYSYNLKQRILSDYGHLSNIDAGLFIKKNENNNKLKNIILAHISKINNNHELAYETFIRITNNKYKTHISNQYSPTELIKV